MDDRITLDYGSGGAKTSELIESVLLPAFNNQALSRLGDGALLDGNWYFPQTVLSYLPGNFPAEISENYLSAEQSTTCVWQAELLNI